MERGTGMGAVVRGLASQQCRPGSIRAGGLSLLLAGFSSYSEGFSPGSMDFLPISKFQFNQDREPACKPVENDEASIVIIVIYGNLFRAVLPLFQGESKCNAILMKMTLICTKMKLHAELIFI